VGFPAVGNALGATLGVRARTESRAPLDLAAVEARYVAEELKPRVEQGVLTELVELERVDRDIGGLAARVVRHRLESRAGALLTWSVLVARGYVSYVVVLAIPEAHERTYARLVDAILARVSFFEPPPVTRARRLTEKLPELASAELELGERLSELGDVDGARGAYLRALDKLPESAGAERALLRLALDYGEDVDDARARARRLIAARPDDLEAHVLAAELEAKRGDADAARALLVGAIERLGDQRELREALKRIAP
jgi:tetratricopeptide (TPR) repeat protein